MEDNQKIDWIVEKLGKMDSKIDQMDSKINQMDSKIDQLDSRMDNMESRMDQVEYNVKDIRLTLENETNKNIMRVAEGHLDLSRKLDEAMKIDNEKEMIAIRVTILENELRKVKEQIEHIA